MGQRSMDAARSRNSHTIYGIPVTSAFHPASTFWMGFMMLVDVTYTAFWVPLGVAFCTDGFGNLDHGCTVADLVGGVVYALNLLLGFQLGCIVRHDYKKYEV
ncbi:cyclic nucleotide-binding domain-containing protein, partial [Haematococcus lacustris]